MKRVDSIDLLKFIAIFMVVFYHSFSVPDGTLNYYVKGFLGTGVPIFFMCNGYILLNRELNLPKIIKTIFKYIFITIFWGTITGLIIYKIKCEQFDMYDFLCDLKNGSGVLIHFWYLGSLICIYMVFPFIKLAKDFNLSIYKWGIILLFTMTIGNRIINACVNIIQWNLFLDIWDINIFGMFNPFRGIFGYTLFYFVLGGVLGDSTLIDKVSKLSKKYYWIFVILLVISNLCLMLFGMFYSKAYSHINNANVIYDTVSSAYDSIFTVCNSILIFLLANKYMYSESLIKKYIRLVAQNTLCIYLVHMVFIYIGKFCLQINNISSIILNIAYAFLIINICLIISLALKHNKISKYIL